MTFMKVTLGILEKDKLTRLNMKSDVIRDSFPILDQTGRRLKVFKLSRGLDFSSQSPAVFKPYGIYAHSSHDYGLQTVMFVPSLSPSGSLLSDGS